MPRGGEVVEYTKLNPTEVENGEYHIGRFPDQKYKIDCEMYAISPDEMVRQLREALSARSQELQIEARSSFFGDPRAVFDVKTPNSASSLRIEIAASRSKNCVHIYLVSNHVSMGSFDKNEIMRIQQGLRQFLNDFKPQIIGQ
jgi:hypothetical protein